MKKPTTVHISAKCSDMCVTEILNEEGNVIAEHDGYVPSCLMNIGEIM